MAQVFVIGRVTADLEPQTSARQSSYIRFDLAENIGYGETARAQFYQVWAWDNLAQHLIKRKIKNLDLRHTGVGGAHQSRRENHRQASEGKAE